MKTWMAWTLMLAAGASSAFGQLNFHGDAGAPQALVTLTDASRWQAGLAYAHVSRTVESDGAEWKLRGDIGDVLLGFSPAPWLWLYAQGGASEARLAGVMNDKPSAGAGGLLGANLNLWQFNEGVRATAWRFTVQMAGQYAWRTTRDEGSGKIEWTEALLMLPLDYHLIFVRTYRHTYMGEFHALRIYAGPACSWVDGTWTRDGVERDFEESETFGAVAGAELWLLENLSFGARAEWFDDTSAQLSVRYRF